MTIYSVSTPSNTNTVTTVRHYFECLMFVGIWVAIEYRFDWDYHYYALLGIPLAVLFQLFVRRRPIYQLWVRGAHRFSLATPIATVGLMLLPIAILYQDLIPAGDWAKATWMFCALAGAIPAGYALAHQKGEAGQYATPSFIIATLIGLAYVFITAIRAHVSPVPAEDRLYAMLEQIVVNFPLCFIIEEVVFRGMIDTHLCSRESSEVQYWMSAIFVSLLWGLWHMPIIDLTTNRLHNFESLMIMNLIIGIPLSICWRRSGTLVLPAAAHALIFAYLKAVFP